MIIDEVVTELIIRLEKTYGFLHKTPENHPYLVYIKSCGLESEYNNLLDNLSFNILDCLVKPYDLSAETPSYIGWLNQEIRQRSEKNMKARVSEVVLKKRFKRKRLKEIEDARRRREKTAKEKAEKEKLEKLERRIRL